MPRFRFGARTITLGYSANVRPARSIADVCGHLTHVTAAVRARIAPGRPFGTCLYLGAGALRELATDPAALARIRDAMAAAGAFLFAVNAFPLGDFHAPVVKEAAFRPDWRDPVRRAMTEQVAAAATALAPEGATIAISTVAGGYRPDSDEAARATMARALVDTATTLARLEAETGRRCVLALEPEPFTTCETAMHALQFFAGPVAAAARAAHVEPAVATHLGVNLDLCHAAVEFEDPVAAARAIVGAGLPLGSVHASAALRAPLADAATRGRLAKFVEPRYLHQTVAGAGGRQLRRYRDLPEYLAAPAADPPADEVRVHFHVPLDAATVGGLATTAPLTLDALRTLLADGATDKVIAETYTFGSGPLDDPVDLADALARELRWLIDGLGLTPA